MMCSRYWRRNSSWDDVAGDTEKRTKNCLVNDSSGVMLNLIIYLVTLCSTFAYLIILSSEILNESKPLSHIFGVEGKELFQKGAELFDIIPYISVMIYTIALHRNWVSVGLGKIAYIFFALASFVFGTIHR